MSYSSHDVLVVGAVALLPILGHVFYDFVEHTTRNSLNWPAEFFRGDANDFVKNVVETPRARWRRIRENLRARESTRETEDAKYKIQMVPTYANCELSDY